MKRYKVKIAIPVINEGIGRYSIIKANSIWKLKEKENDLYILINDENDEDIIYVTDSILTHRFEEVYENKRKF